MEMDIFQFDEIFILDKYFSGNFLQMLFLFLYFATEFRGL